MSEDGINAGYRGLGRLATALIFWAIGIGVGVWLGDYVIFHDIRHQLSQEQRAAVYVGAETRPKSKINIVLKPVDCSRITKADVDGTYLLIYGNNNCHKRIDYFSWHWQEKSPDGTVLANGSTNWQCPIPYESGDTAECKMEIDADDRNSTLTVWTQIEP